jgi:hypothetical protein
MLGEHPGLLIRKGDPVVAKVVVYPEAYRGLMTVCRARRPYEAAGVLIGSFASLDIQDWVTVKEVMPIRLVPVDTELVVDEEDWERLAARLRLPASGGDGGDLSGATFESGEAGEPLCVVGSFYADPDLAVRPPRLNLYTVHRSLAADSQLFLLVDPTIDEGVFYQWQNRHLAPIGGFYELLPGGASPEIPWEGGWSGADLARRSVDGSAAPYVDLVPVASKGTAYTGGSRLPAFLLAALEYGLGSSRHGRRAWGIAVGAELALLFLLALFGGLIMPRDTPLEAGVSISSNTPLIEVLPLQGGGVPAYPLETLTPRAGTAISIAPQQPETPVPTLPPLPSPTSTSSPPGPTQAVQAPATVLESSHTLTLRDSDCTGGYTLPGGIYHGRTARLALGPAAPDAQSRTLECRFNMNKTAGGPIHLAYLTIVGLDSADEAKTTLRISLNGLAIYEGPNPLANSVPSGSSLSDSWGSYSWPVDPNVLLQGRNVLNITNLARSSSANPPFLALDYAAVTWMR